MLYCLYLFQFQFRIFYTNILPPVLFSYKYFFTTCTHNLQISIGLCSFSLFFFFFFRQQPLLPFSDCGYLYFTCPHAPTQPFISFSLSCLYCFSFSFFFYLIFLFSTIQTNTNVYSDPTSKTVK